MPELTCRLQSGDGRSNFARRFAALDPLSGFLLRPSAELKAAQVGSAEAKPTLSEL